MRQLVLYVLIVVGTLATSAAAQSCTTPSETTCDALEITCENGGCFNQSLCVDWRGLPYDDSTPEGKMLNYYWWENCTCPTGYYGTDCRLREPASCNATSGYFDGLMYNFNSSYKRIECSFAGYTQTLVGHMRDHRVEIEFDEIGRSGHLSLYGRTWKSGHVDHHNFGPVARWIDCNITNCQVTQHSNTHYTTVVACDYTCVGSETLSTFAPNIRTGLLQFYGQDPERGFAYMDGLFQNSIKYTFQCYTGACVGSKPDPGQRTKKNLETWVLAFVMSIAVLGVVGVSACAYRFSKKQILDDANEEIAPILDVSAAASRASSDKLTLVFKNIQFSVDDLGFCGVRTGASTRILNSLSGIASSGEVCAVLGLSGSGKTTLLDILAKKRKTGHLSGEIGVFVGQTRLSDRNRSAVVSHMPADDILLASQTVYETVYFSARLRLPQGSSEKFIQEKTRLALRDLGLLPIANSYVGDVDRGGISTGERKRVAIACELVADPLILLLDEPTSGLDSFNAYKFTKVIRQAAKDRGLLCIFSIHQPPANVFELFDKIMLLTRGGNQAYFGEPRKVVPFFRNVHDAAALQDVDASNPAEYMLQIASVDTEAQIAQLAANFEASEANTQLQTKITSFLTGSYQGSPRSSFVAGDEAAGDVLIDVKQNDMSTSFLKHQDGHMRFTKSHAPILSQISLLTARSFRNIARQPTLLFLHLVVTIIAAIFIGLLFYQLPLDRGGLHDRWGLLFFLVFFFALVALSSVGHYATDRQLFQRERAGRYYSTGPYIISQFLTDMIPLRIIPPLIFGIIVYELVGLNAGMVQFVRFQVILVLVNVVASTVCFAATSLTRSVGTANLFVVLYYVFSMIFAGFFFGNDSQSTLTNGIKGVRFLSFFYYGYDALMTNEFTGQLFVLNAKGFTTNVGTFSGSFWLANLGIDQNSFAIDSLGLCMLIAAFGMIGFLGLHRP